MRPLDEEEKDDMRKRRCCVIPDCGATIRNINPKCTTCGPTCTRAKHAGRTRKKQIEYELKHPTNDGFDHQLR